MKYLFGILGLIIFTSCVVTESADVMTFNIRYATERDSLDQWEYRKEQVRDLIDSLSCDFVGLQEALPPQIDYLVEELSAYGFVWRSREVNTNEGEACPLLYLKDKWKPESLETFWLSDTPTVPGSNTWGAACNRVTTWGVFESIESGKQIVVINTHYDHIGQEARESSSRLILERIGQLYPELPQVLLGDLNGLPNNPAIETLLEFYQDPYLAKHPSDSLVGTYHGFKGHVQGKRIDYVLGYGLKNVVAIEILRNNKEGRYPSDHYPVWAEVEF